MRKYTWLFFDLDNTLLDFSSASKKAFFHIFNERSIELDDRHYAIYSEINHKMWVELERGKIGFEDLRTGRWQLFMDEIMITEDSVEINNAYFEHIANHPIFIDGAQELIRHVEGKYNLAMITNGLPEVQYPRIKLTELDKYFDPIIISKEIGYSKPDRAFFEYATRKTGNPMNEDVLVIGDSLTSDIRGGINYGYDTCWYNPTKQENQTEYHATYEIDDVRQLISILGEEG